MGQYQGLDRLVQQGGSCLHRVNKEEQAATWQPLRRSSSYEVVLVNVLGRSQL